MSWSFAVGLGFLAVMTGVRALYNSVWSPRARARRRLAASPSTSIEDGAVVTLTGTVRSLSRLLEAPLTGEHCVAFHAWSMVTGGANDLHADRIVMQEMLPFDLATSHGVVRVDATSVDLAHPTRAIVPRDPRREAEFLTVHRFNAELARTSFFQQAVVVDGDKVRVQGLAVVEQLPPSDAHGYRETDCSIRIVPHHSHPLTIGPA